MDQTDSTVNLAAESHAGRGRRLVRASLGYLLAAAGLVWVLHDVHLRTMLLSMTHVDWTWVGLAVVFDVLSYVCQGARWSLLLSPTGTLSTLRATQAIYIGLFTNEIVPMRLGEVVRAYLVSRWLPARFATVISSMLIERFLDGIWLAAAMGLTAIFLPLPKDLLRAGDLLGVVVLVAIVFFLWLVLKRSVETATVRQPAARGPAIWLRGFAGHLAEGVQRIGLSRTFYAAAGLSLALLGLQIMAFWLVMWACNLRLSFWIGAVVLLIVHLGTAIPNAPSNVGTYQFFTVVGLTFFGVEKSQAAGFSIVVFVLLTLPLWLIGLWSLSRSGMTLRALRSEMVRLRAESMTS